MDENPCAERHSWEKRDIFRMTDAFLRGLNRKSEHAVNIIHVRDEQIAPCRGCFGCRQRGDDLYRHADVMNLPIGDEQDEEVVR